MIWRCRDLRFDLARRGEIMGIVNATPDSFSDGGQCATVEDAVARGLRHRAEGAAIVDVGGESTRPGAPGVDEAEELRRVIPVVERLRSEEAPLCLSVDTCKPVVAAAALAAGADVINDVTGFRDPAMVETVLDSGAGLVVMHMLGTPRTMQRNPKYRDVVAEVRSFFAERHETLVAAGVAPERIVYDPGIGFGKTTEHNLALLRSLDRLAPGGRPLLLGVSRKSFIGKVLGAEDLTRRSWPTVALTSWMREKGVPLHRVHEVRPNVEALRMTEAMLGLRSTG